MVKADIFRRVLNFEHFSSANFGGHPTYDDGAFIVYHFNILNLFKFKLGNCWLEYYGPLVDANSALA